MNSKEYGYTLLEILVVLSISTPLLYLTAKTLLDGQRDLLSLHLHTERVYRTLRAHQIMQRLQEQANSAVVLKTVRLHPQGAIAYSDASPNPIAHSINHAPNPQSNAITVTALDLSQLHDVTHSSQQQDSVTLVACARFRTSLDYKLFTSSKYSSYVGLTLSSAVELTKTAPIRFIGDGCRKFTLKLNKSMSFDTIAPHNLAPILSLVPITQHYTLYLNRNRSLRHLSHIGSQNSANEPLLEQIDQFLPQIDLRSDGIYQIETALKIQGQVVPAVLSKSLSPHHTTYNLLLR